MAKSTRILIADPDPIVAETLAELLTGEGYRCVTARDGGEAADLLDAENARADAFGIVVTEMDLPRYSGLELLKTIRKQHEGVVPIVITGYGKLESAVAAIKLGAADYLTKPLVDKELLLAVSKAVNHHSLVAENKTLKDQLVERFGMGSMIGGDYRMQKVYDLVEAVAESKTTVLVTGESGTGKTMVARAIHTSSPRKSGPFVTFSCGSIPETLLESELFGHVKGAFTGADNDKSGKILAADGGTLFIDEINSATPALQLKLLRVLQEKAFEPVGSTQTIAVDVRFVLASNADLREQVDSGAFREDLYYRINVVNIPLPPLRDRVSDIPLLADHFLTKYCAELERERRLSNDAVSALQCYAWPGNVRELENAIERAVVLSRENEIGVDDMPDPIVTASRGGLRSGPIARFTGEGVIEVPALADGWTPMPLSQALQEPERQIILAALEANDWNRQETARQLDINRTTLYKKIKQYALDIPA